jgi:hypothetical protein
MQAFRVCVVTVFLSSTWAHGNVAAGDSSSTGPAESEDAAAFAWDHRVTGKIVSIEGHILLLETRDKRTVSVDATPAINRHFSYMALRVGGPITAFGAYDSKGVLQAQAILRAKNYPSWPVDR